MKVNKVYLEASFVSFIIHGIIILYLLGFFYFESQQSSVLSKPINVNLIFEQPNIKNNNKTQVKKIEMNVNESSQTIAKSSKAEESISFDSLIESISPEDLLKEDVLISLESEQNQIEIYSSLIIQTIQ